MTTVPLIQSTEAILYRPSHMCYNAPLLLLVFQSDSTLQGGRTSRTTHDVTAVKECMLPPVLGQSTEDSQGVVYIVLTFVFANIACGG